MRTLMKEYLILVTQLEHLQRQGLLSLQKLWFYIQPTMRTMEILASIGETMNVRLLIRSWFGFKSSVRFLGFNFNGKRKIDI